MLKTILIIVSVIMVFGFSSRLFAAKADTLATLDLSPAEVMADWVILKKASRKLYLMKEGKILKEYNVGLGGNPKGHKQQEGDNRTPEGHYILDWRNPESLYHLSLHVSYPNEEDTRRAKQRGVSAGSNIMIHGQPNEQGWAAKLVQRKDWTEGCIAVKNAEIEEIWKMVGENTPIDILP
ncbi:MAG: L,D-transpeptidase family protein [Gammaproteobacteria bacterium]|nr:L,D-transpeptidase family protein [Gammaproteobacteria bacterium]